VRMSNTEVGIYTRLLCYCWLEGSLPLETAALAHMARMQGKQFTKLWENSPLRTCFQVGDDGRLHHKRLDEERDKQDHYRRRASDGGKAALGRRGTGGRFASTRVAGASTPTQAGEPSPAITSTPISNLLSPISDLPSLSRERVISEEDTGDRARCLLENYPVWYAEKRHGARLPLLGNSLQFQDALTLCSTWDDARLEKLAKIVLTATDDDWINRSDRGWKVFVSKASWADDRLRQWEAANRVAV
jgi:uncharacterized protein YdaU (DUF1376 family)